MDSLLIKLGYEFRKKREQKGYTTESLAAKLGLSKGTINNIEQGKSDVFKIKNGMNVMEILQLDVYKVVGIKEEEIISINTYDEYEKLLKEIEKFLSENNSLTSTVLISKFRQELAYIEHIKKTISES